MKILYFSLMITIAVSINCFAHGNESESHDKNTLSAPREPSGHHLMTHPFLSHMGLPDEPGQASVRLTQIQRSGPKGTGSDAAIHAEAGIVKDWGLHIRNDAINNTAMGQPGEEMEDHGTEIMLMYALLHNDDYTRGLSIFGQTSWPTVQGTGPAVRGAYGIGLRWLWENRILFDGNIHLDSSSGPVEVGYEISLQARIVERFFLLIENRETSGGGEPKKNYVLPAMKMALGKSNGTLGVGLQYPTTPGRDYDRQTMLQIDWGFD